MTTPGIETVSMVVTGSEDGAPPRIQVTFAPVWSRLLPTKVDVSGSLADVLVLTPAPDNMKARGRSVVDRYPNGVCRLSLHTKFAARDVSLQERFHLASVALVDGRVEIRPVTKVEAPVGEHPDATMVRLRAALEVINSAVASVPGATLRVENNRARVTVEI